MVLFQLGDWASNLMTKCARKVQQAEVVRVIAVHCLIGDTEDEPRLSGADDVVDRKRQWRVTRQSLIVNRQSSIVTPHRPAAPHSSGRIPDLGSCR